MHDDDYSDIYRQLGITPVINATGNVTLLGGSILSPGVQAAMEAANRVYAPLEEVLDKTGARIAQLLNAESAFVTSGCFAALVLGIAGLLTDGDPDKIARLPDTTGMKDEILLQKPMRYHYDRCITVPGAKLVEVGDAHQVTTSQLAAAIGPKTAGVFYFARGERMPGVLPLRQVIEIAHNHGVPVIVDAASEIYPVERMTTLAASGADLICFGAKYLGAQNSAGILCGKRTFVAAARANNFVSYESQRNRALGRGYKLDRQEVIAVTVALQEWLTLDHEERLQQQADRITVINQTLADLPQVTTVTDWDASRDPWMRLLVRFDEAQVGKSQAAVIDELRTGEPRIWLRNDGDALVVMVNSLTDAETALVAQRLRAVLGGA
jgi:L-seryl-tRNA(Ser) seleniumtransferase